MKSMRTFLRTKKRELNLLSLQIRISYEYTKNHKMVHFKGVNFIVCELYCSKAVTKVNQLSEIRQS